MIVMRRWYPFAKWKFAYQKTDPKSKESCDLKSYENTLSSACCAKKDLTATVDVSMRSCWLL